jgi:hypothetical protein
MSGFELTASRFSIYSEGIAYQKAQIIEVLFTNHEIEN